MWNLSISKNNDLFSLHCKVEAQKKHLSNINNARPLIDNRLPWMPYRAYNLKNKNENERSREIYNNNKILLHKMEKIDGGKGFLNPTNLLKNNESFNNNQHFLGVLSKRMNYHKKIEEENMSLLKRLHSAKTFYGKKQLNKSFLQNEQYRRNFSKTTKKFDIDYTTLAKLDQPTFSRKNFFLKTETNSVSNKNLRAVTAPKILTEYY